MIRVLVVDDEALVREALRQVVTVEGVISVSVCDSSAAMDAVRDSSPDVVLLEVVMPAPDGFTLLAGIRALPQPPPVALLTTFDSGEQLASALCGGAVGFLLKDSTPELLRQAVLVLASGGVVFATRGSSAALDRRLGGRPEVMAGPAGQPLPQLTRREREVLTLVTVGLSNAEIAEQLRIGVTTVKTHITELKRKLHASNRVALATVAHRADLA
ncbi:response regulator transcription factor [Streptomyces sp. A3M-1-3]|uniref:response regulator transcription factor n=1 Tax=Streptomyces sp. A3M-1-3 TaxID=2962044 RepID=UPI0020B7F45C|nr:response regulator transcription factor [Streptomyces sp. A3M-1-3]MCP3817910.1 response regulator transcription factor [Streptomyces sp. A3M-1-3]